MTVFLTGFSSYEGFDARVYYSCDVIIIVIKLYCPRAGPGPVDPNGARVGPGF